MQLFDSIQGFDLYYKIKVKKRGLPSPRGKPVKMVWDPVKRVDVFR